MRRILIVSGLLAVLGRPIPAIANEAANLDLPPSRFAEEFNLGLEAYDSGAYARAYEIWLPIAKQGDLAAMRNIAHLLRHGMGVDKDLETAARWYSSAAKRGLTGAQVNLAELFYDGDGVPQSYQMAAQWYARAARSGHAHAQYKLARMIEDEETDRGNEDLAKQLYLWAIDAGHSAALERYRGLVARKSPIVPVKKSGNEKAKPISGTSRLNKTVTGPGELGKTSLEDQDAASAELLKAQSLFIEGRRGDAVLIWRKLALAQNSDAQFKLGVALLHGQGARRDPSEAQKWLEIAATAGHPGAEAALATLDVQSEAIGSPM